MRNMDVKRTQCQVDVVETWLDGVFTFISLSRSVDNRKYCYFLPVFLLNRINRVLNHIMSFVQALCVFFLVFDIAV